MAETPQKCKPSGLSSSQVLRHDPSRNTKLTCIFKSRGSPKKIQEFKLNSSRNQTQNMLLITELAIKLNICVSIVKRSARDHHKCYGYKMTMRERQLVHKSCFHYLRGLSRANHSPQGVVQLPGLGQFSISPNRRIQASQVGKCGCKSQAVQHLHVGRGSVSQSFSSALLTGTTMHKHKGSMPSRNYVLTKN